MNLRVFLFFVVGFLAASASHPILAGEVEVDRGFQLPPAPIQEMLDRDAHYDELEALSPDGRRFVIPVEQYFSSYEVLGRKTYRLAMLEIVPEANREWRLNSYGVKGLKIYSLEDRSSLQVDLPEGILVSDVVWSPGGDRIAFLAHLEDRSEVWVADASTGEARPFAEAAVMATLAKRPRRGSGVTDPSTIVQWLPDGSILTLLVPAGRGPEPSASRIPDGPLIRTTRKKPTPTPTYPFLLRTPHDQELFRYYTTAQLARLSPAGEIETLGDPAMYLEISASPSGEYLLAEKLVEPFSYIVGFTGFPRTLEVMDLEGRTLSTLRELPLRETQRWGAGDPNDDHPREVRWRADGDVLTLQWKEEKQKNDDEEAEEEPEEDDGPRKDRLMALAAPFSLEEARLLADSEQTFTRVEYSREGRYAFARLTGKGGGTKNRHNLVAYDLSGDEVRRHDLVTGVDPEKPLEEPGEWVTRRTANGHSYALTAGDEAVYLQGEGPQEDFRPRPFVDRVQIESGEKVRVFRGSEEFFDEPKAFPDPDLRRLVFTRESSTQFPDSYLWRAGEDPVRLTANRDPFPEVAECRRIDFEFERRDGLMVHARLTLPVGYQEGTRVPTVFWTYPREFDSKEDYRNNALENKNRKQFHHLNYRNASEFWLTQGYAVVEPDIPIVGGKNQYNNNYIAHLVDSMYGAIRKVDQMGYVDVDRLGHGGHSYGAFATANILVRTPFFKAGIAGHGAYNRTLTPMGFQRERRFLWEAQDTIVEMSPFFYADHLDTPLLMYHGMADNNTGTFVIQSERLIQALTGLGKTAVLYEYPFESHGPRAMETYLDLWARWLHWFDRYVKQAGEEVEEPAVEEEVTTSPGRSGQ